MVDKLFLEEILGTLEGKDRELIFKRYFQEKTQAEIAREMGISQVQVSDVYKRQVLLGESGSQQKLCQ